MRANRHNLPGKLAVLKINHNTPNFTLISSIPKIDFLVYKLHDFHFRHRIPPVASISPLQSRNSLYSCRGISPPIGATARHLGAIAARHGSIASPTGPVSARPVACIRPTALRTELSPRSSQSRRWDRFEALQPPNAHSVCSHSMDHLRFPESLMVSSRRECSDDLRLPVEESIQGCVEDGVQILSTLAVISPVGPKQDGVILAQGPACRVQVMHHLLVTRREVPKSNGHILNSTAHLKRPSMPLPFPIWILEDEAFLCSRGAEMQLRHRFEQSSLSSNIGSIR